MKVMCGFGREKFKCWCRSAVSGLERGAGFLWGMGLPKVLVVLCGRFLLLNRGGIVSSISEAT